MSAGSIASIVTGETMCSPSFPFRETLTHQHVLKDTRLLGVGYRCGAASCHVAVEGHLQSVAIGCVIEKAAEEASPCACLHHVPVEGRVGLWETPSTHKGVSYFTHFFCPLHQIIQFRCCTEEDMSRFQKPG